MSVLNSEDLRLFLVVLREGNMLAAARRMGVDHSTVARRLTALETMLGARLFDRSPRGVAATPAAFALVPHAERIERELLAAAASVGGTDRDVEGVVRIATPEAFASHLLAPHVGMLKSRHPRLMLELATENRAASLSRREADLAVTLRTPPRGRLVARRLMDYRLGLYASEAYLAEHGLPGTRQDLSRHVFVSYIEELAGFPEMIALDQILPGAPVVFRASSSAAQQMAVGAGVGIGMLHAFAAARDHRLVPVLPDLLFATRSYWLVMHADLQRLPRVRAVSAFLDDILDDGRKKP